MSYKVPRGFVQSDVLADVSGFLCLELVFNLFRALQFLCSMVGFSAFSLVAKATLYSRLTNCSVIVSRKQSNKLSLQ